jgi:hypothetical protein
LRDLRMTHQVCIRNTLNEERFYVPGALVMASSLRRTEIKQVLSVRSLQTFWGCSVGSPQVVHWSSPNRVHNRTRRSRWHVQVQEDARLL